MLLNCLNQLCEGIKNQEGMSALDQPYSYTTTDNGIGYLHRVPLQVHGSFVAAGCIPYSLTMIEHASVSFTLVACSITASDRENVSSTLVPQLVKAVMDLSSTERIICLADIHRADHPLCNDAIILLK